jgi:hypothetical protein
MLASGEPKEASGISMRELDINSLHNILLPSFAYGEAELGPQRGAALDHFDALRIQDSTSPITSSLSVCSVRRNLLLGNIWVVVWPATTCR